MKAILILDAIPIDCEYCPLYDDALMRCYYLKNEEYGVDERPDCCPLKPMPKKYEVKEDYSEYTARWLHGWNTCLEEIEK